jgi:glutathione S-transferase
MLAAMKLYYVPFTRAHRVRWMLEELGVPYELCRLDPSKKENREDWYLAIHPHGHVPALEDDGVTMFESAAIVMYLADKYPDKKLAPPPGTKERAAYYQWMVYSMSELEPGVAMVSYHTSMRPPERRIPAVAEEGRARFADSARVLTAHLQGRQYMLGEAFSAVDVMIAGVLGWGKVAGLLEDQPRLLEYFRLCASRDAAKRARKD